MTGICLQKGDQAPDFTLPAFGAKGVTECSSQSLKGQIYLLYFYPKAMTPGCTTQACALRDALVDKHGLMGSGLPVFGVSPDPVKNLRRFYEKEGLNFTLISDEDHKLSESYGVWVSKSMYGRTYMGIERSSFLIDAHGKIMASKYKIRPAEQVEWVKNNLAAPGA